MAKDVSSINLLIKNNKNLRFFTQKYVKCGDTFKDFRSRMPTNRDGALPFSYHQNIPIGHWITHVGNNDLPFLYIC